MKNRIYVIGTSMIAASIMFTLLMPSPALAKGMLLGKWWNSPQLSEDLDLTRKEKHALDELYAKDRETIITLKGAMAKERFKLHDMLGKDDVTQAQILTQNRVVEEGRSKISQERIKHLLGIKKILGTDRFNQLMSSVQQSGSRNCGMAFRQGHHRGGGNGACIR